MQMYGEEMMPGLLGNPIGTRPSNVLFNGKGVIIDVSNFK